MRNVVFILILVPIVLVAAVCIAVPLADVHWLFDVLALPLHAAYLVSLVAGLVAVALQRWLLAAAAAAVTVLAFAMAWSWTVAPPPPSPNAARFKLLSFNLYWRNQDIDEVVRRIEALDADVVVLLEAATPSYRAKLRPLDRRYPQRFECWQSPGCDILVFSRFPIKEPHVDYVGSIQRSPVAWFEISPDGCALNVFATHLTRPFPLAPIAAQDRQADDLAGKLRGWPGAKILVGDLNAPPWGHVVKTVENQANLRVSLGPGGTWHARLPPPLRLPIDHVMASEGLEFVNRKVVTLPGSDHAAVLTEIAIADRTKCW